MKMKRGNIEMVRALTKRDFISKAVKVHGNKFDYSKVYYENSYTEVCIICPSHGEFWQRPKDHIYDKHGCQSCGGTKLKSKDQFIQDATKVHGDRFDYSKVEYKNNKTNVIIICSIHGEFMQSPNSHISQKQNCPKCSNTGYSKISIQFLNDLAKEWKVDIQHAENRGEYRIDDPEFKCYYKADGYFEQNNKRCVVEFQGNYYHGNPKIYKPDSVCKLRRITFGELYKKTEERMCRIKALGYEVIYIWELDYMQYLHDRDNEFFFEGLFEYYRFL